MDHGYETFDLRTHAEDKSMWAGATKRVPLAYQGCALVEGEPRLTAAELEHTPALFKAFDELLVNASDHAAAHPKGARRVTYVKVEFAEATGVFTVENNGPGIPVVRHEAASARAGKPVFIPEIAFCDFLSGTNMNKAADSIKGGVNGVGAKLANVHSRAFIVETDDGKHSFRLICQDRLRQIGVPAIGKSAGAAAQFTRVKSLPVYAQLGYTDPLAPKDAREIADWLRLRCLQLAAYLGDRVVVTFNGWACATTDAGLLAGLYAPGSEVFSCLATPRGVPPLTVALAFDADSKKLSQSAVVNGVCSVQGPHVAHFKALFRDQVVGALKKLGVADPKVSPADATKCLTLVVVGAIPGAEWSGQRKDVLELTRARLDTFSLKKLSPALAALVADQLSGKKPKARKAKAEKYQAARKAGGARRAECRLLVAEGDSAIALLKEGLACGSGRRPVAGAPSFDLHGVFSLQGVPMNAARNVSTLANGVVRRSDKLRNNRVFAGLETVLNLDHGLTYAAPAERARLAYGGVVACVDQDLDGAGKILGLLLVYFQTFWPALLEAGFVQWFMTPVIRVFAPGLKGARARAKAGPLAEFFHEERYETWAAAEDCPKHAARYYKGLGSHSSEEIPWMFSGFRERLYVLAPDEHSPGLFAAYFAEDSAPRKAALRTAVATPSDVVFAAIEAERRISCSLQLDYYVKAYKLDAIGRQIPGVLDVLTESRRKAVAGARVRFAASGECKTFQLAGYVADLMLYHHGGGSLENTLTMMCQTFPGGRQFNLFEGLGMFGSRAHGGADHANARYTSIVLNKPLANALFPPADDPLLAKVVSDGVTVEPVTYVPVLPLSALETLETPSEGWRYASWGRRLEQVAALVLAFADPASPHHAAVRAAQRGEPDALAEVRGLFPLAPSTAGFGGRLGTYRGRPCHYGACRLEGALATVTELPMRVWTEPWLAKLEHLKRFDELIESVQNFSSDTEISIEVRLRPGALAEIEAAYGGEPDGMPALDAFLGLRTPLRSYLNFVTPDGSVVEFDEDYHALVLYGLQIRQDLYMRRVERLLALCEMRAALQQSVLDYFGRPDLRAAVSRAADEEAAAGLLSAAGFARFRAGGLTAPGDRGAAEIRALQLEPAADARLYSYLLDLKEREGISAALAKRREKTAGLLAAADAARSVLAEAVPCGSIWRAEIHALLRAAA